MNVPLCCVVSGGVSESGSEGEIAQVWATQLSQLHDPGYEMGIDSGYEMG